MGLAIASTRFLVKARHSGVQFDHVLTLGRQNMVLSPRRVENILREFGFWPPPVGVAEFHRRMQEPSQRFDTFARALGAQTVTACDMSGYEGATLVHDLNLPVPRDWEEKFDVVIDGGTLEHVFNFPVAIANCMRMVRTGGHLILLSPANNYFGHGFYQFSPELFYRVLSQENGFKVARMLVAGEADGASSLFGVKYSFSVCSPEYEVNDPAEVHERVTLINNKPILVFVLAQKISANSIFDKPPQQSDYADQWKEGVAQDPLAQSKTGDRISRFLRRILSESFCREVLPKITILLDPFRLTRFRRRNSCKNKRFYKRVIG